MARLAHPLDALLAARGLLFPWVPVCLAAGIGLYFSLPKEPGTALWALAGVGLAGAALAWARAPVRWHPVALMVGLVLLGALAGGLRSQWVAAPVLPVPYYGPVTGRVVVLDRSSSDRPRLTLDRVVLDGIAPAATPARVRVSLQGRETVLSPEPGQTVILTARLAPPGGPVEPGGFDFRRMAWFDRLGAVGYTATPVLLWAPAKGDSLGRLRMRLAASIRDRIPGEAGAFAAAVATGDRSAISRGTIDDLRASNLAHLLAISGLHMGLLTAFVFAALRAALSLVPPIALRLPVKKIAAVAALAAAAAYLALSGGNVATQRAFVMVAVMLGAVLADRRALTLRSVAIAATLILLAQPESLAEPGFQMSFAATTALVAAFEALRGRLLGGRNRLARGAATLVFSSAVAGFATAPIAAATFNRVAEYGLLANVLSVPVMGLVVMPGVVLAVLLAPLGLAGPALWAMGQGARWILAVAHWVAGLHGAVVPVATPPEVVLPLMALGALWLILWRGGVRWLGAAAMMAALVLWATDERPLLFISDDGRLAGVMTPAGRTLSRPKGAGFVARNWLAADGDTADQTQAAARSGFTGPAAARRFDVAGRPAIVLSGKGALAALAPACAAARLVILADVGPLTPPGPCLMIDARLLARSGSLSVRLNGDALTLDSAAAHAGRRPWTRQGSATPAKLPAFQ